MKKNSTRKDKPIIHWAGLTDIGKVRQENQDAFYGDTEMNVFMVSDGMGGAAAGRLASEIVVKVCLLYTSDAADE